MSWTEGINTTASGSGRVDDIEGHLQGEIRGPTKLVKMRGDAMRWTGSPKGENEGCSRVNGARGERCDIDNVRSVGHSTRTGRIESIILSRRLDAIRDSRIASQMAFGTLPGHVRHQRFAAGAFPRRLRAWRERNNLSQSEAALKLQISKRTLQEWEQGRAAPRGFARTAIEKAIHA